jgi:hypothetical protein
MFFVFVGENFPIFQLEKTRFQHMQSIFVKYIIKFGGKKPLDWDPTKENNEKMGGRGGGGKKCPKCCGYP